MSTSWITKYLFCFAMVLFVAGCGGGGGGGDNEVLVLWTPPTLNSDGSALTDLSGYRVYYGNSPNNYDYTITIDNPHLTSFEIDDLPVADYYFVMTAYNSLGIESSYSREVFFRVGD